jgi:hypothetical protein
MTDKDRIDFLESHPANRLEMRKHRWSCVAFTNYEYQTFKTAREAIDDAIRGAAIDALRQAGVQ